MAGRKPVRPKREGKSDLQKILDAHTREGDDAGGESAFIRALYSGAIRLPEGARVPGNIAVGLIQLDAASPRPLLTSNKKEKGK